MAFSPRIIFKNGSTGWGNAILLKCGNRSQQRAAETTEQSRATGPRATPAPTDTLILLRVGPGPGKDAALQMLHASVPWEGPGDTCSHFPGMDFLQSGTRVLGCHSRGPGRVRKWLFAGGEGRTEERMWPSSTEFGDAMTDGPISETQRSRMIRTWKSE